MSAPLILIIEDNSDLIHLYCAVLGLIKKPFETAICLNGRDGLARVQKQPEPKIILLDLHLPYVEGIEIFEAARASAKSTIIVITADILAGKDMFSKADHVFIKPLDIPKFMSVIKDLL